MKLIIPIVNLNGDKKDILLTELMQARYAVEHAVKTLRDAQYANGRNYQYNPAGEAQQAYRDHSERVNTLERIAHELLEIQYEISNQEAK